MTASIPADVVEEVRASADIVNVIGEYVVLKKKGKNLWGLCPFHNEDTPSFSVSPEKQLYYCFGCGSGGNVFTFLMRLRGLTFPEAVQVMADRVGIKLPENPGPVSAGVDENKPFYDLNLLVANAYHNNLLNGPLAEPARKYLAQRGLTGETIASFQIGYAPDSWHYLTDLMAKGGIPWEKAAALGLVAARSQPGGGYYDRFRHRIMFPIIDLRGRVVGFGGRVLGDGQPKYLNSPESSIFLKGRILFALHRATAAIQKEGYAVVMEGYMDVITAHQYGIRHAVATLGTALTRDQVRLITRYTRDVVIAYDADRAGQSAALKGLDLFHEGGCRVRVAPLPQGMDPDEMLHRFGAASFRELLENKAQTLIAFKLEAIVANANPNTLQGRLEAFRGILPDLKNINSAVERHEYVRLVAQRLNLAEEAIYAELAQPMLLEIGNKSDKRPLTRHNKDGLYPVPSLERRSPEQLLLRWMVEDPVICQRVLEILGYEVFEQPLYREVVCKLVEAGINGEPPTPASLAGQLGEEAASLVAQLFAADTGIRDAKGFDDLIRQVKLNKVQARIAARQAEIQSAEREGRTHAVAAILQEIRELQREAQRLKNPS